MLPTLKQHALITAALVASMTLSACGSKKDVFKQPEQPKLQSRPMSDPSQQQQGDNSKDNSKKDNKPLPLPLPPKPGQQQPGQQLPKPKSPVPQSPKPVDPSLPAPLPDDSNSSKDSTKKLSKRATGGVSEDGLIYTSSAPDNLLEFLRARNERVDENSRQANLKAAASVVSAKLILDGSFGEDSRPGSAIVSLKIQEGRDEKIYNLSGDVNDNNAASFLRSVGAANGQATTGTRAIEGTLKCLDL
ncbi:MAG TPA: hypothetical protein VN132_02590, partial [Bdellovibrio sp.]|nr:hypothetical protein [Bdellovibrio sp.]